MSKRMHDRAREVLDALAPPYRKSILDSTTWMNGSYMTIRQGLLCEVPEVREHCRQIAERLNGKGL